MIIVIFLYVTLLQYIILHYYNWVSTPERQFQSMWWMRQNILKPDWICKNDKWVVYGFVCENDFDKSSCEKWPGAVCLCLCLCLSVIACRFFLAGPRAFKFGTYDPWDIISNYFLWRFQIWNLHLELEVRLVSVCVCDRLPFTFGST